MRSLIFGALDAVLVAAMIDGVWHAYLALGSRAKRRGLPSARGDGANSVGSQG